MTFAGRRLCARPGVIRPRQYLQEGGKKEVTTKAFTPNFSKKDSPSLNFMDTNLDQGNFKKNKLSLPFPLEQCISQKPTEAQMHSNTTDILLAAHSERNTHQSNFFLHLDLEDISELLYLPSSCL